MPSERDFQGTNTMIPLPNGRQFSFNNRNSSAADSKLAKTETNQLRLTMQTRNSQIQQDQFKNDGKFFGESENIQIVADDQMKERKIETELKDNSEKKSAKLRKTTIPRYTMKVMILLLKQKFLMIMYCDNSMYERILS
jgi:hypothetical protein